MAKTIITSKDDKVVWGTMIAIIVVVIGWTCVLVYGIKKDVSQIKNTVLNIQETLKPIENINDPVGLIQHMGNRRPLQKEYPEANFHNATIPDEPEKLNIEMQFTETLESKL